MGEQPNMLEPAIPEHLRVERKIQVNTPQGYNPPFPGYTARFSKDVTNLVMSVIGAQFTTQDSNDETSAIATLTSFLTHAVKEDETRPKFLEWAAVTDTKGFYNIAALAYWKDDSAYELWATESGFKSWWDSLDTQKQKHGWFLEVFFPSIDRFETIFSNNEVPEGAAHMRESVAGPIQEHVYWGSMRDRLAVTQTDVISGDKATAGFSGRAHSSADGKIPKRVRVPGKRNLAIIRSGQDWLDTSPEERELYLSTMHPVLTKGMHFLRDQGDEVGCWSCRFMDIIDPTTRKADKDRTFGLAYFDELGSLERWSKEHPTHLAIFGGFLQYAAKLNNNILLRLFHEVMVLTPDQQLFEYVGCHPGTGMLVSEH